MGRMENIRKRLQRKTAAQKPDDPNKARDDIENARKEAETARAAVPQDMEQDS